MLGDLAFFLIGLELELNIAEKGISVLSAEYSIEVFCEEDDVKWLFVDIELLFFEDIFKELCADLLPFEEKLSKIEEKLIRSMMKFHL